MKRNKQKGFTVLEMLLVILILALLYSIAAFNITGLQKEARIAQAKGDLKTLELALTSYLKNTGVSPLADNYQTDLLSANPKILEENLVDPFGTTNSTLYSYIVSIDQKYFVVYSIGIKEDGSVELSANGNVVIKGAAIFETNGYL